MLNPGAVPGENTFFGHPRGLAYLAFTEAWERFSFYGMQSLLVLYLVQELLLPGHIENVVGMASYRSFLESLLGPLSGQALASQTVGFYGGLVYLTPLIGGWIADRWLGAKRTVLLGVLLMTAGHAAMAFEQSVLLALVLLIVGSGCLKGNIAAQVGRLYARDDETRSTRGYAIFSTGINIGAMIGPIVCGALAQAYGWHVGFGTAGIFMLIACAVYLAGQNSLPEEPRRGRERIVHAPLTSPERRRMVLLFVVLLLMIPLGYPYDQEFIMGLVWISTHVDMNTPFGAVPASWFYSLDAFSSVMIAPVLVGLWRWQARRGSEPCDFTKIAIGGLIMAVSPALIGLGAGLAGEGKTTVVLPLTAFIASGIAFMWYWPTLLSVVSRAAPAKFNARMMAMVYMTTFVSASFAGYMGTLYEKMPPTTFWAMTAAIGIFGSLSFLLLGGALDRALRPDGQDELPAVPPIKELAA